MNKKMERDFSQWTPTIDFIKMADQLSGEIPHGVFFNATDTKHQNLREAYITGKFARIRRYSECRLIYDVFPDAEVRIEKKSIKIEITELQDKGRKRGEEYRIGEKLHHQNESLLNAVINNWPKWLAQSVQKKAAKHYNTSDVELVIYMNVSLYDWPSEKTAYWEKMQSIPNLIQELHMLIPFKHVWVLHQNRVLQIWPEFQKFEDESIAA